MKSKLVRTRYAPSPTGLFHIGGARTALFNFLFAKANDGIFVIRIEDTDFKRNVDDGIRSQLDNLKWLKIFPDESIENPGLYGPYIQSEKIEIYKEKAYELLKSNKAYRCFCTQEELEEEREKRLKNNKQPKYSRKCLHLSEEEINNNLLNNIPYVIRLKINDNIEYTWDDLIRGKISIPSNSLTDPVILKSNGYPMYNFAVVIDDYEMKISHVLRGEEHISNTPYQLAIAEALEYDMEILYGHLSIIIDETGKKLSKRNIELKQFIEDYSTMGFTPEAIFNYICLLGWSGLSNKEIFNVQEAIQNFNLDDLSSSPSMFDFKKMEWISNEYFKSMDEAKFLNFVDPFINLVDEVYLNNKEEFLLAFKNQISYAKELNILISDAINKEEWTKEKIENIEIFKNKDLIKVIRKFSNEIKKLEDWNFDAIKLIINEMLNNFNFSKKEIFLSLRIASTTKRSGIELYKIIKFLGKENVLKNIKRFLEVLNKK